MTTLLLTRGPDPRAIEVRRCGPLHHLLVRIRSLALDRALAAGAAPDSSAALSLRARTLISVPHRVDLARKLRALVRDAGRPFHPFDAGIPVPRDLLGAREFIDEVADLLDSTEPVDARGVAQLQVLLRDGSGPLYGAGGPAAVRRSFQEVIRAMTLPPPAIHADA
jgi:hypothetical protein